VAEDANPFEGELFGQEHVRAYQRTAGKLGYHWRGTTILLLTTVGRVSGEERTTPLIFRQDGNRYVVIASKGGSPENPDWYENLEATHDAVIQIKEGRIPVSARTAHGEERARLWEWMAEVWPDYRAYQARTEREIPVVVFEAG
jgi:deazaflavin-dependent oxidoreductase (nitroreductase family)